MCVLAESPKASRFDELEAAIALLPKQEMQAVHHFDKGVTSRTLYIPAGTMLTGKKHRKSCLNIVAGDITVFNEAEGTEKRITGHAVFSSPAGTRRVGLAHAPTAWTTIHLTDETDEAKIEAEVIEPHHNPLLQEALQ